MIKFTVKEQPAFRLRIEGWEALSPKGLFSINFVQECLNDKGEVDFSSTYNYHLTKEEINTLIEGLKQV